MGGFCTRVGEEAAETLFKYNTIKTVQIKSKTVGLIFRFLQLAIIGASD